MARLYGGENRKGKDARPQRDGCGRVQVLRGGRDGRSAFRPRATDFLGCSAPACRVWLSPGIERKENDAQQPFYGGLDRENALHPQSRFSRITGGINSTALRRTVMVRECSALSSAWKQLVTMLITPSAGADRQRTCRNCAVCAIWGSLWREMPARCAGWNGNRFGCTAAHPASVGVGGQGGESRERSLSTAGTGSELPSGAGALKRPRT